MNRLTLTIINKICKQYLTKINPAALFNFDLKFSIFEKGNKTFQEWYKYLYIYCTKIKPIRSKQLTSIILQEMEEINLLTSESEEEVSKFDFRKIQTVNNVKYFLNKKIKSKFFNQYVFY